MKILTKEEFSRLGYMQTSGVNNPELDETVLEIIREVREKRDEALLAYTKQFDGVDLDRIAVSEREFLEAKQEADPALLEALQEAAKNIRAYHEEQKDKSWMVSRGNGILLGQIVTPIDRVGVYVPGGKAGYPSTVLMAVIPAQVAGVEEIVITTPPGKDGRVNPDVLVAADLLGISAVYKAGGAQSIAALAYGTESIHKVDKIVGPGNAYVAQAKKWVYGDVGIDLIAGPSEICIIADDTANPRYAAADLLSQAEHDETATAICITTSRKLAEEIQREVKAQTAKLERKAIIEASISTNGKLIVAETLEEAAAIANSIAPEHLELMVEHPLELLPKIKHAGAIFLGSYSPEPLGDYFAGPNHTLPTSGTARFASGLGVDDFVKTSTIIHYPKEALKRASDQIITLATTEGLTAHARSIEIRKDDSDA